MICNVDNNPELWIMIHLYGILFSLYLKNGARYSQNTIVSLAAIGTLIGNHMCDVSNSDFE